MRRSNSSPDQSNQPQPIGHATNTGQLTSPTCTTSTYSSPPRLRELASSSSSTLLQDRLNEVPSVESAAPSLVMGGLKPCDSLSSGFEADSEAESGTESQQDGAWLPSHGAKSRSSSTASRLKGGASNDSDVESEVVQFSQPTHLASSVSPSPLLLSRTTTPLKANSSLAPSNSTQNLQLSSQLSRHFGSSAAPAHNPKPSLWRRIVDICLFRQLSPRAVTIYSVASIGLLLLCRTAVYRSRLNRTMLTFGGPFIVREAPQIFLALLSVGILRTAVQSMGNKLLLLGVFSNIMTFPPLLRMFRRLVRVGASPFREALEDANIPINRTTPDKEDVLTIVPYEEKDGNTSVVPTTSTSPVPSSADDDAIAAHTKYDYSRVGHMSRLRWFLTGTQLVKTLAWAEEVQSKTGIVFERLQTRHKTHRLKLDIYRPKAANVDGNKQTKLPCVLYIHGGGWVTGHRSFHSLSMLYALAKAGFLVVTANYRLSPYVRHPTHLLDCKRALRWVKEHAEYYGGDPNFIIVGGESAGSHLASLLALTPNVLWLQPGFEHIDTRVQGVFDLYGPRDFTDSHYHYRCREDPNQWLGGGILEFLRLVVMGSSIHEAQQSFEMASPLFRLKTFYSAPGVVSIDDQVPPFFGCHGMHDEIVPVEDSVDFYKTLKVKREKEKKKYEEAVKECQEHLQPYLPPARNLDVFIQVPHASHGFNNVLGPRSFGLNDAITVWAKAVYAQWKQRTVLKRDVEAQLAAVSPPSLKPTAFSTSKKDNSASLPKTEGELLEMQQVAAEVAQEQEALKMQPQPLVSRANVVGVPSTFSLIPKL